MKDTAHVVCPHCDTVNRVQTGRLSQAPTCGKCGQPLFNGQPVELSGDRLARHIAKSDLPVLVDFWAPWCGPCKMMGPAYAQAASALAPLVRAAKLNTEENQAFAGQFGIRSIPTMVLFKGGREADRISGAMPAAQIADWVRARL